MRLQIYTKKTIGKYAKYIILSKEKKSKEENDVLRSLFLSNPGMQCIGTLPTVKGRKGTLHFSVEYKMSNEEFDRLSAPSLPILSAPEMRKAIFEDRKKDEEIALANAQRTATVAKQLGLYSLVPKDLRPRFECRCGMRFKKKLKLLSHQRNTCPSLKEAEELFEMCAVIKAQLKAVKKVKSASKAPSKKGKTRNGKPLAPKVHTRKPKRQKDAKASKRKTPKRKQR